MFWPVQFAAPALHAFTAALATGAVLGVVPWMSSAVTVPESVIVELADPAAGAGVVEQEKSYTGGGASMNTFASINFTSGVTAASTFVPRSEPQAATNRIAAAKPRCPMRA